MFILILSRLIFVLAILSSSKLESNPDAKGVLCNDREAIIKMLEEEVEKIKELSERVCKEKKDD